MKNFSFSKKKLSVSENNYTGCIKKKVIEIWSALACLLYNLQKSFFHSQKDQAFSFRMSPFVKFEERQSKCESNEDCRSKSHISTSERYYGSE